MIKIAMIAPMALLFAASAMAQPVFVTADELPPPTVRVSYADLDLGTKAGRTHLELRIRGAADRVCKESGEMDLEIYLVRRSCFKGALADGLQQMDRVIARHKGGSDLAAAAVTIRAR
jgi:UrcA family protein